MTTEVETYTLRPYFTYLLYLLLTKITLVAFVVVSIIAILQRVDIPHMAHLYKPYVSAYGNYVIWTIIVFIIFHTVMVYKRCIFIFTPTEFAIQYGVFRMQADYEAYKNISNVDVRAGMLEQLTGCHTVIVQVQKNVLIFPYVKTKYKLDSFFKGYLAKNMRESRSTRHI